MAISETLERRPKAKAGGGCGCGCGGGGEGKRCASCDLSCFERPQYHCGHLLTDADLSLEMRYVVEKNKLRNRALHGYGVVCGLKLTCDADCCDHILVHEGYAIDRCGSDIVVCETECFDVLGALQAKGLIPRAERRDPCKPDVVEHDCHVPQCFYVTICYREEEAGFETPFQSTCAPGPQDCAPTRVRERYTLGVTDELPKERGYLEHLEDRFKRSFRLFMDSPVGRLIGKELEFIQTVVAGKATIGESGVDKACQVFCLLKAQFQQFLKQAPDRLTCDLAREVACLACPEDKGDSYAKAMQAAYLKLLELMHRYQYDSAFEELAFSCQEPAEGGVIVLGCVEVDDCCVVRVSNLHRSYVWSFAQLQPLLAWYALTGAAATSTKQEGANCCGDPVDFDARTFLTEFAANPAGRYLAAAAPIQAMRALQKSLGENFTFTQSGAHSPGLLAQLNVAEARRHAEALGLRASVADPSAELKALNPLQAFLSQSLVQREDALRILPGTEGALRALLPDFTTDLSAERGWSLILALQDTLGRRDETITALQTRLGSLEARIAKLEPAAPASPA